MQDLAYCPVLNWGTGLVGRGVASGSGSLGRRLPLAEPPLGFFAGFKSCVFFILIEFERYRVPRKRICTKKAALRV